jgi:hypothetical protein
MLSPILRPLGLGFGGKRAGQSNIGHRRNFCRPIKIMLTSTLISHNSINMQKGKFQGKIDFGVI